jgi:hypothetical protein
MKKKIIEGSNVLTNMDDSATAENNKNPIDQGNSDWEDECPDFSADFADFDDGYGDSGTRWEDEVSLDDLPLLD